MPKMEIIETGGHSPPVYAPEPRPSGPPAELDRDMHRALVEAGCASLGTYVRRFDGR